MAISKIGGTVSDNWELISSVTPTAASAAVNFTGLSPYKKFLIKGKAATQSLNAVSIRLNNDSGTNYDYSISNFSSSTLVNTVAGGQTGFEVYGASSGADYFDVVIENCDNTGLKLLTYGLYVNAAGSTSRRDYWGVYVASAIVSQVNVVGTGTFSGAGTISLYGVK